MSDSKVSNSAENILKCQFFAVGPNGDPVAIDGFQLFEAFKQYASGDRTYVDAINNRIDERETASEPGSEASMIDEIGGVGTVAEQSVIEVTDNVISEKGDGVTEDIEGDVHEDGQESETPVSKVEESNNEDEVSLPVNEVEDPSDAGIEIPEDVDTNWITEIDDMQTSGFKPAPASDDFDPSSYVSVYNAGKYDEDQVKGGLLSESVEAKPVEKSVDDLGDYEDDDDDTDANPDGFSSDNGFITSDEMLSSDDFEGEVTTVDPDEEDAEATPGEDFADAELDPYLGANPSSIDNPFADFDSEGEEFEESDIDFGDDDDNDPLKNEFDFNDNDDMNNDED